MADIENTTERMKDRDAMLGFLAEGMIAGPDAPILAQEAAGQRQLVNSDKLPADMRPADRTEWEALGFTFGEPDPQDPMFMPATLPEGWAREGSDHAMWSYIKDPLGRRRVSIFYKAAFYDRSAHMNLTRLENYVTGCVMYDDGPLVFDEQWATREAVVAALRGERDYYLQQAASMRGHKSDPGRSAENLEKLEEIAQGYDEKAAAYETAAAEIEAGKP